MISVSEGFDKFQHRLETTDTEDQSASRRQRALRGQLDGGFDIDRDFLTGSYVRHTKTKPLRDVDIMIVLQDRSYLDRHPRDVLEAVRAHLAPLYGDNRVVSDRRAVRVDFGVAVVDDLSEEVVSFDVVPAFTDGDHYLIPDDLLAEWIPTNPEIHKQLATTANKDFSEQWKPLVKMIKTWNNHQGKPIDPSFLVEVMALDILTGQWTGDRPRELRQFFATAARRISERWKDPAGLGPDISDVLHDDAAALAEAQTALLQAEKACTGAMNLQRAGRIGEALSAWQDLLGPAFAKS
jgi:hypothetical protein